MADTDHDIVRSAERSGERASIVDANRLKCIGYSMDRDRTRAPGVAGVFVVANDQIADTIGRRRSALSVNDLNVDAPELDQVVRRVEADYGQQGDDGFLQTCDLRALIGNRALQARDLSGLCANGLLQRHDL